MLPVLPMCSQCTHWVYGSLSPVTASSSTSSIAHANRLSSSPHCAYVAPLASFYILSSTDHPTFLIEKEPASDLRVPRSQLRFQPPRGSRPHHLPFPPLCPFRVVLAQPRDPLVIVLSSHHGYRAVCHRYDALCRREDGIHVLLFPQVHRVPLSTLADWEGTQHCPKTLAAFPSSPRSSPSHFLSTIITPLFLDLV